MSVRTLSMYLVIYLPVSLMLAGCQSAFLVFPGKALTGETYVSENIRDQFLSEAIEHKLLTLETNSAAPYSVFLRTTVIEGELYVDAAFARKWGQFIAADPQVRVKLGSHIYAATAVQITQRAITQQFPPNRSIYRLDPIVTDLR